jgi:hypothetical protein
MKGEIATPFGLAMTKGTVKIFNAFVLVSLVPIRIPIPHSVIHNPQFNKRQD